jgi:hypothetical protein
MKNLVVVGGTMGVGKTATCRELQKILPRNVFLDGDWCWDMHPFVVTDETKAMVNSNIAYLLNGFLACSEFENVIFCWVLHEQHILDNLINALNVNDCTTHCFSLVSTEQALVERLNHDIAAGKRGSDIIELAGALGRNQRLIPDRRLQVRILVVAVVGERRRLDRILDRGHPLLEEPAHRELDRLDALAGLVRGFGFNRGD